MNNAPSSTTSKQSCRHDINTEPTHVICNVSNGPGLAGVVGGHHVGKVPLVDLDVRVKGRAKGLDLHVIPPSTTSRHSREVLLKDSIHILGGGSLED